MNKTSAFLLGFGLVVAPGCGEKLPTPNTLATSSHGGQAFQSPDRSIGVEIGSEPAGPSTPGVSRQNSHVIFAYFTQADGTTPLASTPTDVKLIQGSLPPIELKPKGDPGRFESPPAPRPQDLRGVLEATVKGRKAEVSFQLR